MATPPIRDNSYWYDWTAFMPEEYKESRLWCSQVLFFMKLNSTQFLDTKRKKEYRKLERLEIDANVYKQLIDPITPMGGGGDAKYFAADWKANPIDVHLDNIVRSKLDKIGTENKLQVSEIDKFAKTQKEKDKEKIIYQREFRNLINSLNQEIGLPPIKESQSPYSYVQSLGKGADEGKISSVDTLLDYIRSQIKDEQDLVLYESYIYKGDIEQAFELAIEHYLINMNKWRVKCEDFNADLKNFNKACGRWYIDETNGRGTVEYIEPDELYTSFFREKNGEDILYWFYEKTITFAEFVRQFGTTLNDEQLKEVFELNRYQGGNHGMSWKSAGSAKGSNARIRIGYASVLTQDAEKFAEKFVNNKVPTWQKKPLSWLPDKHTPNKYKAEAQQRMYNVWYSFYYVPPPGEKTQKNSSADWEWQSQYIFNIKKDIDMYRYGVDMRYAKSTLVIWKDERASFTDIKQAFMPKIHTAWHRFQNCLINDIESVLMAQEFLGAAVNAVDENNKRKQADPDNPSGGNGVDVALETFRMMKQGGMAFVKMTDKNGNPLPIDPSKFVIPIKNNMMEKAEKNLNIILQLYNMMTVSLAQNDISEGQDAKPRTPVAGIQASLASAQSGIWFIEKPVREFLIMFGERCVQHIICMIKERKKYGYKQRFEELQSVVGKANVFMLEAIEDINPEEIGLTVDLEDVHANQQYVIELANKMADNGQVGYDVVGLVMNQVKVNYKYSYALLMVEKKRKEKEQAEKEQLDFERAKELKQMDLQTAMALNAAKGEAKDKNIQTQGMIDAKLMEEENQLKENTMRKQKDQLKQNRLDQDNNKFKNDRETKITDALT